MHSMYVVNTYIEVEFVVRYFQWYVFWAFMKRVWAEKNLSRLTKKRVNFLLKSQDWVPTVLYFDLVLAKLKIETLQQIKLSFSSFQTNLKPEQLIQFSHSKCICCWKTAAMSRLSTPRAISRTGGIPKQNRFVAFNSKLRKNRNLFWKLETVYLCDVICWFIESW